MLFYSSFDFIETYFNNDVEYYMRCSSSQVKHVCRNLCAERTARSAENSSVWTYVWLPVGYKCMQQRRADPAKECGAVILFYD